MATGSYIGVTPGAGAKLSTGPTYTEGGNVLQDQKIIFGEPYVATYTVAAAASTATANSHIIQLMAGASLNVYIRRIVIEQRVLAGAATIGTWQVMRLSTAGTGGTVLSTSPFDASDSASGATAMQLPSSKGTEGAALRSFVYHMAGANPPTPGYEIISDQRRSKPIKIPAGTTNGIVIKCETAIASGYVNVQIGFMECAF